MIKKIAILLCLIAVIAFADNRITENVNAHEPERSGVSLFVPDLRRHDAGPVRDRVGENQLVSDENRSHQNETASFVSPIDPQHIVGGCNDYRSDDVRCGYFVTFDGGRTWEDGVVEDIGEFGASGDPSVVIDNDGRAYMCGIAFNRNDDFGGIYVSISEDGGSEWGEPNWVIAHREGEQDPPFEDKCYIGIDNGDGEFEGNIYVSWTRFGGQSGIYFSKSEDGGEQWSEPIRLTGRASQGSVPTVGPDGELYVIWKDFTADRMIGVRSDDGGDSFGDIFVVAETENIPRQLAPTEFRVNSFPSSAVDNSDGENRGRVYVCWADHRLNDADIMLAWSDNSGDEWSEPIRLNDDEEQNGIDQFFSWVAVDATDGSLYGVWYDRRLDDDNFLTDVYGIRWNGVDELPANERISSETFNPTIGFDGLFIGDYNGISAFGGTAHPVWSDTRNNNQDVFWAPFTGARHFIVEPEQFDHTYILEEVLINGEAADDGDEVAIAGRDFGRDGLGPEYLVNASLLEGDPPYEIATPDDSYLYWKVWDSSEWEEVIGVWELVEARGDETVLRIIAPPPDTFRVDVRENWSFVSIPFNPVSYNPVLVFNPEEYPIAIVKDGGGHFFVPDFAFNNLGTFSPLQGYQVRAFEEFSLEVPGIRLDPQTPIPLRMGWNLAPYLPDHELGVNAWASIVDNLLLAKNGSGRFYAPAFGFNNIPGLFPGEAYQLRMSEADTLIYPEEE